MNSQNDLNTTIFSTTTKIQEEFPELNKYLDEIPEYDFANNQKEINNIELKDYLESLKDLLSTYSKEH